MDIQVVCVDMDSAEVIVNGETMISTEKSHSCRRVFLFPDFVLKVDAGAEQNENEINFYISTLQPEDEEYFPKMLNFGIHGSTSYIVQERIEVDPFSFPTPSQEARLDKLRGKYYLSDIGFRRKDLVDKGKLDYNHNITPVGQDSFKIYDLGFC